MSQSSLTPEERFADLVDDLASHPDVTPPESGPGARRRFGASALKVRGKVFAMLSGGRLTLKLPAERVEALLASGDGERFDPRRDGRMMREWVTLAPGYSGDWLPLAQEARAFVGAQAK
ncbi:MAG TPA: TfoX/Sxy family protein [Ktedonobacterales bacterium]|jgi:hypothetical protein|nr:TfoX/Sxy family protein [Ktedonobacterales bacterium]